MTLKSKIKFTVAGILGICLIAAMPIKINASRISGSKVKKE